MPFTRRTIFAVLAAVGFPVSVKAATPRWRYIQRGPSVGGFAELESWLAALPIKQVDGSPSARCEQTGEPYVTHSFGGLARPGDEKTIEAGVAARMQRSIVDAIELAQPKRLEDATIHWRQRLAFEVGDYTEYDPTRQRMIPVEDWRKVSAYCRLTVSA